MYHESSQWPQQEGKSSLHGMDSAVWHDGRIDGLPEKARTWADEDTQNWGGGMTKWDQGYHPKPYEKKRRYYCCCVCRCCYWSC